MFRILLLIASVSLFAQEPSLNYEETIDYLVNFFNAELSVKNQIENWTTLDKIKSTSLSFDDKSESLVFEQKVIYDQGKRKSTVISKFYFPLMSDAVYNESLGFTFLESDPVEIDTPEEQNPEKLYSIGIRLTAEVITIKRLTIETGEVSEDKASAMLYIPIQNREHKLQEFNRIFSWLKTLAKQKYSNLF
jgi:hypothetical protein